MKVFTGLGAIAVVPSYLELSIAKLTKDYERMDKVVQKMYDAYKNINTAKLFSSDFKYIVTREHLYSFESCLSVMEAHYKESTWTVNFKSPSDFKSYIENFWRYHDTVESIVKGLKEFKLELYGHSDSDFTPESVEDYLKYQLDSTDLTLNDLIEKAPELINKNSLDINPVDFSNVLRYLQYAFELKPYFSIIDRIERLQVIGKSWAAQRAGQDKFYSDGTPYIPESNSIENLYHVSLYSDDLLKEGFKKEVPKPEERYGLGAYGKADKVSFTTELRVATEIARYFKESWLILHGHYRWPQVLAMIQKDMHKISIKDLIKGTFYYLSHKIDTTNPVDVYHLYDRALSIGELKFRSNPLVADHDRFVEILQKMPSDKSIGIIQAEVNMKSKSIEFVPGLSEVRAAPADIIKVVRKI
jgi:hypothetical protein